MRELVDQGNWGHSQYFAYKDWDVDINLFDGQVTGVAAVCFDENGKVVLMNYEPLGGHLELGESIEDALKREGLEEGGIKLTSWRCFGYYEIKQSENASVEFKEKYPSTGYILFFVAKGIHQRKPYGKDVTSTQVLSKEDALSSALIKHKMLVEGVKLFPDFVAG